MDFDVFTDPVPDTLEIVEAQVRRLTLFNPGPTDTQLTGLGYLEGKTVQILADGVVLTERTVVGVERA